MDRPQRGFSRAGVFHVCVRPKMHNDVLTVMRAVGVIDREILAAPGDQSEVKVVVQPTAGGVRQVRAADSGLNYCRALDQGIL